MAIPKVFVSSTCYDLREIRDSLYSFIKSFGFDPVLSENGDVFYHPELHTHDSCIYEISNCQLFILIIGGRFGGAYVADKTKSITNAEYEAAIKCKIPVFTYIKRAVIENHHLYQSNRDKKFISELHFPGIEKQEDATQVFEFINKVRKASVNNAYEPFETSRDIESHLRKQWASMFFDSLKNKELTAQISSTSNSLDGLKNTADKLEELVKSLYKSIDKENAEGEIKNIEKISLAKEFLNRYVGEYLTGKISAESDEELDKLADIDPSSYLWHEYISLITFMREADRTEDAVFYTTPDEITFKYIENHDNHGYSGLEASLEEFTNSSYEVESIHLYNNGLCKLSRDQRKMVLQEYSPLRIRF